MSPQTTGFTSEPDADVNSVIKGFIRDVWPTLLRAANLRGFPANARFEDATIVQLPEHRLDQLLLFEPPDVPERVALCLEYALNPPNRKTLVRWLWKTLGAELQLDCPAVLLALYLWRGSRARFPNRLVTRILGLILRIRFPAVHVWEWRDRILSGELRELAGLLVFCEDRPTRATLEQERALLLHPSIPAERRSRLIWSAVLFATRHFPVELILDVYQRERTMIREMPFIQEWEQEARALGLAEGRTEGKAEGKAEGIAEGILTGAKNLFLTLARQRLGEPNPQAASYLAGLHDPNEIQRLGARMLEVESWDELLP